MSKLISAIVLVAMLAGTAMADAASSGTRIKLGPGCIKSNINGTCTINASGGKPGASAVVMVGFTTTGPFHIFHQTGKFFSSDGTATFKFRNHPGKCFKVKTAAHDFSNVLCE